MALGNIMFATNPARPSHTSKEYSNVRFQGNIVAITMQYNIQEKCNEEIGGYCINNSQLDKVQEHNRAWNGI